MAEIAVIGMTLFIGTIVICGHLFSYMMSKKAAGLDDIERDTKDCLEKKFMVIKALK